MNPLTKIFILTHQKKHVFLAKNIEPPPLKYGIYIPSLFLIICIDFWKILLPNNYKDINMPFFLQKL